MFPCACSLAAFLPTVPSCQRKRVTLFACRRFRERSQSIVVPIISWLSLEDFQPAATKVLQQGQLGRSLHATAQHRSCLSRHFRFSFATTPNISKVTQMKILSITTSRIGFSCYIEWHNGLGASDARLQLQFRRNIFRQI